jgi:hypothetical protein
VSEVEHHDVQLWAERRLEVFLPVEPVLRQLLRDRVDRLLFVRELVRELVDRLPLRRAQDGVDRELHRDRRRDEVGPAGRGARRAAATREPEGEEREQSAELAR